MRVPDLDVNEPEYVRELRSLRALRRRHRRGWAKVDNVALLEDSAMLLQDQTGCGGWFGRTLLMQAAGMKPAEFDEVVEYMAERRAIVVEEVGRRRRYRFPWMKEKAPE